LSAPHELSATVSSHNLYANIGAAVDAATARAEFDAFGRKQPRALAR
jgi:hypothetical protein